MTTADTAAIVAKQRRAQGLPLRVDDAHVLSSIARLVRDGSQDNPPPRRSTRSASRRPHK